MRALPSFADEIRALLSITDEVRALPRFLEVRASLAGDVRPALGKDGVVEMPDLGKDGIVERDDMLALRILALAPALPNFNASNTGRRNITTATNTNMTFAAVI